MKRPIALAILFALIAVAAALRWPGGAVNESGSRPKAVRPAGTKAVKTASTKAVHHAGSHAVKTASTKAARAGSKAVKTASTRAGSQAVKIASIEPSTPPAAETQASDEQKYRRWRNRYDDDQYGEEHRPYGSEEHDDDFDYAPKKRHYKLAPRDGYRHYPDGGYGGDEDYGYKPRYPHNNDEEEYHGYKPRYPHNDEEEEEPRYHHDNSDKPRSPYYGSDDRPGYERPPRHDEGEKNPETPLKNPEVPPTVPEVPLKNPVVPPTVPEVPPTVPEVPLKDPIVPPTVPIVPPEVPGAPPTVPDTPGVYGGGIAGNEMGLDRDIQHLLQLLDQEAQ